MKSIPPQKDAIGREMWAFLHGGPPFEIVERDDGYIDVGANTEGYFAPFAQWPEPERHAMRLVRGIRVLDVGCGAGRVSLHLQRRGMRVTAIDNSPLAIRTARKRGVRDARLLAFQDVGILPRNTFDTVVMFGNNFALFGSCSRAEKLL